MSIKKSRTWKVIRGGLKGFSLGGGIAGVGMTVIMLVVPITAPVAIAIIVGFGLVFAIEGMVRAYRETRPEEPRVDEDVSDDEVDRHLRAEGYRRIAMDNGLEMAATVKELEQKITRLQNDLEKEQAKERQRVRKMRRTAKSSRKHQLGGAESFFHPDHHQPVPLHSVSNASMSSSFKNDAEFAETAAEEDAARQHAVSSNNP